MFVLRTWAVCNGCTQNGSRHTGALTMTVNFEGQVSKGWQVKYRYEVGTYTGIT